MTMTSTTPADDAARARDLAELGNYVRTLADRMGLKDWAFAVDKELEELDDYLIEATANGSRPRARFRVGEEYFAATPDDRRYAVVRELVGLHLAGAHLAAIPPRAVPMIAAAWAPCLPLPLVGLMRRLRRAEGAEEGAK